MRALCARSRTNSLGPLACSLACLKNGEDACCAYVCSARALVAPNRSPIWPFAVARRSSPLVAAIADLLIRTSTNTSSRARVRAGARLRLRCQSFWRSLSPAWIDGDSSIRIFDCSRCLSTYALGRSRALFSSARKFRLQSATLVAAAERRRDLRKSESSVFSARRVDSTFSAALFMIKTARLFCLRALRNAQERSRACGRRSRRSTARLQSTNEVTVGARASAFAPRRF